MSSVLRGVDGGEEEQRRLGWGWISRWKRRLREYKGGRKRRRSKERTKNGGGKIGRAKERAVMRRGDEEEREDKKENKGEIDNKKERLNKKENS